MNTLKTRYQLNLPPEKWLKYMYFIDAPDEGLRELTKEQFPATPVRKPGGTHPIFVLLVDREGPIVCPGSTKNWNHDPERRYIRAGAVTTIPRTIEWHTFLAEEHSFPAPRGKRFRLHLTNEINKARRPLLCLGQVSPKDVLRGFHE